jgi:hypothetical protein
MAETFRQRWIPEHHTRQSVHPATQAGEFTTILTFSLSGWRFSCLQSGKDGSGMPDM